MRAYLQRATLASIALLAVAAFAAGCGDDDDDPDSAPTTGATSASSPAGDGSTPGAGSGEIDISDIEELDDGTLNIGSDIAYAPIEFLDEATNEPVGLDIDIANALAEVLGVEATFDNSAFDGLLPALDAERYDVIMSAMTASATRKEQVDFVEYFNSGAGIVVAAGNPSGINSAEDLCGKTVAVQEGTTHVDLLLGTEADPGGLDQQCQDDGNDGITVRRFQTDPEAVLAVTAEQADANIADFPVAAYTAEQSDGDLMVVPVQIEPAPYGIAIRKSSTALRDALQAAFDEISENGTVDEILAKWGLEAGKLE